MTTTPPRTVQPADLDRLEALSKAAVPGPWRWGTHGVDFLLGADSKVALAGDIRIEKADAALIAESRNALDALIAEARLGRKLLSTLGFCDLCGDPSCKAAHAYRDFLAGKVKP